LVAPLDHDDMVRLRILLELLRHSPQFVPLPPLTLDNSLILLAKEDKDALKVHVGKHVAQGGQQSIAHCMPEI
jgi:hypothetical protein